MSDSGEITALLAQWRTGGPEAGEKLFELVFESLRRIAANQFRGERANHTLQPTAVVNEVWLKLVGQQASFNDRAHFFALAAQAMRRILVDHARQRRAQKRDAPELLEEPSSGAPNVDVLALDDALQKLVALDKDQARIVELKYFAGLTNEEVAEALGTSVATVKRSWQSARAFLFRELEKR
ncbi:MAG: sigma-70 family RNA polymerase sigma factor [Myxococcaceae bacterium]